MSRLPILLTLSCLLGIAAPASAQTVPAGDGAFAYTEKVKVKGCGSAAIAQILTFTVNANGTWAANANFGDFSGTLVPADTKGLAWNLVLDGPSEDLYETYLETVAEALCEIPVDVTSIDVDRFTVKFGKGLTQVSLQLKAGLAGSSALGAGSGGHAMKGKGVFVPD